MEKFVLLTFDLEEFDLPSEFGCPVSDQDQINVTNNGLHTVIDLLDRFSITATFFTTAFFAERNRDLLRDISLTHEVASHSRIHTGFTEADPLSSKLILEEIIKKPVNGFRMPRFSKVDMMNLRSSGYKYDSSINPTFIPGRYNNTFSLRRPYIDTSSGLTEFPLSVSPVVRFPLFWLSFKNIPFPVYMSLCRWALCKDSYLHLYFHPWEFDNLERFRIPRYVKALSGTLLLTRFEKMITELKKTARFLTVSEFLDSIELKEFNCSK